MTVALLLTTEPRNYVRRLKKGSLMDKAWIALTVGGIELLGGTLALADRPATPACQERLRSTWGRTDFGGSPSTAELFNTFCGANPSDGAVACMSNVHLNLAILGPVGYVTHFGVVSDFCRRNPSEAAAACFWKIRGEHFGSGSFYQEFGPYHADQLCSLAVQRGVVPSTAASCVANLVTGDTDPSGAIQLCGRDPSDDARRCFRDKKGEGYPQWPLGQICGNPVERALGISCLSDLVGQGFSQQFSASFCARTRSPAARACIANARELGVPLAVGVQECLRNPSAPNFALFGSAPAGHCVSDVAVLGEGVHGPGGAGSAQPPSAYSATP